MFLGITCPRAGRIVTSQGIIATEGDPFGDEALSFTKDLCMQREVNHHGMMCSTVTVERFEKLSLNFSIALFVIRVNLLHP